MADVIREWAGKERLFRLTFGSILDVEEACNAGIGAVFIRVANGTFHVSEVYHVIRLALIGGGLTVLQAKQIMDRHFDAKPVMTHALLAADILTAVMTGIEEVPSDGPSEPPDRYKFSEASQICREFKMSPQELRAMRYADFVNLVRGFNAASTKQAEFPSEEEFLDILERYEPEALAQ